jgi:hypothetical protein
VPSESVPTADAVLSAIGSNVVYAAILEFGGDTKPHVIKAKKGGALKFILGGQEYLRKQVNHPARISSRAASCNTGSKITWTATARRSAPPSCAFWEGEQNG